jgi:hypothetical protein
MERYDEGLIIASLLNFMNTANSHEIRVSTSISLYYFFTKGQEAFHSAQTYEEKIQWMEERLTQASITISNYTPENWKNYLVEVQKRNPKVIQQVELISASA